MCDQAGQGRVCGVSLVHAGEGMSVT
jgi:hypothetical protein